MRTARLICYADDACGVVEMDCGTKCVLLESCASAASSGCDSYILTLL